MIDSSNCCFDRYQWFLLLVDGRPCELIRSLISVMDNGFTAVREKLIILICAPLIYFLPLSSFHMYCPQLCMNCILYVRVDSDQVCIKIRVLFDQDLRIPTHSNEECVNPTSDRR